MIIFVHLTQEFRVPIERKHRNGYRNIYRYTNEVAI